MWIRGGLRFSIANPPQGLLSSVVTDPAGLRRKENGPTRRPASPSWESWFFPAAAWDLLCPHYLHEIWASTHNLPDLYQISLMSCSQKSQGNTAAEPSHQIQNILFCPHSGPRVFWELWGKNCIVKHLISLSVKPSFNPFSEFHVCFCRAHNRLLAF